jgi:hypothetical protein
MLWAKLSRAAFVENLADCNAWSAPDAVLSAHRENRDICVAEGLPQASAPAGW